MKGYQNGFYSKTKMTLQTEENLGKDKMST